MNKRIIALICAALALTACTQTPAPASTEQPAQSETEQAEALAVPTETATEAETTTETTTQAAAEETTTEETAAETTEPAQDEPVSHEAPDLTTLGWDTDYASLTNAKAYKISDGDIAVDLDGDGTDEILNFTHENDDDEAKGYTDYENSGLLPVIPYINGEPAGIKTVMNEEYGYAVFDRNSFSMPSGYIYICDIDASDSYKEIAFVPYAYTDDYMTVFVRYKDGQLEYAGSIGYDSPDPSIETYDDTYSIGDMNIPWGRPLITDGSGIVTAATRLSYQTWFGYTQYAFNEDGILAELAGVEVYPYGYENRDSYDKAWQKVKSNWSMTEDEDCMLTRDITVYSTPSEDGEAKTITAQPAIPTGEVYVSDSRFITVTSYDDWDEFHKGLWVYVAAKDGTCGWMHAYPYDDTADIFSVMTMYD